MNNAIQLSGIEQYNISVILIKTKNHFTDLGQQNFPSFVLALSKITPSFLANQRNYWTHNCFSFVIQFGNSVFTNVQYLQCPSSFTTNASFQTVDNLLFKRKQILTDKYPDRQVKWCQTTKYHLTLQVLQKKKKSKKSSL